MKNVPNYPPSQVTHGCSNIASSLTRDAAPSSTTSGPSDLDSGVKPATQPVSVEIQKLSRPLNLNAPVFVPGGGVRVPVVYYTNSAGNVSVHALHPVFQAGSVSTPVPINSDDSKVTPIPEPTISKPAPKVNSVMATTRQQAMRDSKVVKESTPVKPVKKRKSKSVKKKQSPVKVDLSAVEIIEEDFESLQTEKVSHMPVQQDSAVSSLNDMLEPVSADEFDDDFESGQGSQVWHDVNLIEASANNAVEDSSEEDSLMSGSCEDDAEDILSETPLDDTVISKEKLDLDETLRGDTLGVEDSSTNGDADKKAAADSDLTEPKTVVSDENSVLGDEDNTLVKVPAGGLPEENSPPKTPPTPPPPSYANSCVVGYAMFSEEYHQRRVQVCYE